MAQPRKVRQVRKTLLVVGEGDSEVAFLKHLRQLYCSGGAGVTVSVHNAHGLGPENVISTAITLNRMGGHDRVVAFLDTDIPWPVALQKAAQRARVQLVGSTPCLEGLLLGILQQPVPDKSDACKKSLHLRLGHKLTDRDDYQAEFGRVVLDEARIRVVELNKLIDHFEGV